MPFSASKICPFGHPPYSGRRCPVCTAKRDAARGSASSRGYDQSWRRFREDYLRRYPWCSVPGCNAPADDVDHIVALREGGARFDPANVRSMCHWHHSQRTGRDHAHRG
jgi:5-methylcytosine-specific restriction endonuclease McrA